MFRKFCIALFLAIFCNGVAYSSPIKANSSDLISKEQAAVTEALSHINHKIEFNNTATDAEIHHTGNANFSTSTNHSIIEEKTVEDKSKTIENKTNYTSVEKIINQSSDPQNHTETPAEATTKSPHAAFNDAADSSSMPNATSSTAKPVTKASTITDLPPRNLPDMSRPIVPGQSTITGTTLAAGTTTKAPVTMPTVVSPTPAPAVSTSTGNVILVDNSSTKAQENRFDGASFVGGIVLTIGLTAIGFIAFKYYKSGYY